MKILLLFPILFYLLLIIVNKELIISYDDVNIFGAATYNVPFLLYNAIFIVLYAVLVFFAYDGLNLFLRYKLNKQEKEITELKSKLYDGQKEIIKNISKQIEKSNSEIKKENKDTLKAFIKENKESLKEYSVEHTKILVKHGKETDRILAKVNLIDKGLLTKIKDSIKA